MANIGYLLPAGDAFTEELGCCLVFYPDRDEYRRALMGSLDYLGTWVAWERDDEKRGVDAARAWKLANLQTWECCSMGFCDQLLTKLDRIIALLALQRITGDGDVTYGDNVTVITTVVPGVGDAPSTWGESSPVADWDEWEEYVCGAAHKWVDDLIESNESLETILDVGGFGLDFMSWFFRQIMYVFPFTTIAVNMTILLEMIEGVSDAASSWDLDAVRLGIETSRNDIICAIILDGDLAGVIEDAVGTIAWLAIYQWIDYENVKAVIYDGEVDGHGFLSPEKRFDCVCVPAEPVQLITNPSFDIDTSGWTIDPLWFGWLNFSDVSPTTEQGIIRSRSYSNGSTPYDAVKSPNFTIPAGVSSLNPIVRLRDSANSNIGVGVQLHLAADDSIVAERATSNLPGVNNYVNVDAELVPFDVVAGTEYYVRVRATHTSLSARSRISSVLMWTE